MSNRKAIGLFSGGLDSVLAAKLIMKQGIEVICLVFDLWEINRPPDETHPLEKTVKELGAKFRLENLAEPFLKMLTKPDWGYGTAVNPCIDCKFLMMKRAGELMKELNADFVFTGEVMGQRPMTQNKPTMTMLQKRSGLEGYLLRPLCAKIMPETIPEKEGKVDRSQLMDIQGRSRKRQIALAKEFGIEDFETPAGGCILTQRDYGGKVLDFLKNNKKQELTSRDMELFKIGRHFRLSDSAKLIIGRNDEENTAIQTLCLPESITMKARDFTGPLGLLEGNPNDSDIRLAASIVTRYGKGKNEDILFVQVFKGSENNGLEVEVSPIIDTELEKLRIIFNRKELEDYRRIRMNKK